MDGAESPHAFSSSFIHACRCAAGKHPSMMPGRVNPQVRYRYAIYVIKVGFVEQQSETR